MKWKPHTEKPETAIDALIARYPTYDGEEINGDEAYIIMLASFNINELFEIKAGWTSQGLEEMPERFWWLDVEPLTETQGFPKPMPYLRLVE